MLRTPTINLAKGRGQTFVDRFLNWALSVGRVIVIITEGVALGAFLFRFDLDRQIIDLHSKINQEQIIVKLLNKNEDTFRNLQDRLHIIGTVGKQAGTQVKLFSEVISAAPANVTFQTIDLGGNSVKIEASAQSSEPLASFVKQLKGLSGVTNVSVDKIENRTTTATIIITISVTFTGTQGS